MALNYRRGSAAIEDAATTRSGGSFRPFLPEIFWKEDQEMKYVLVLTDIEDVAELLLHQFIPVGKGEKSNGETFTRYEEFLSRKDPALAEEHDDLEDRLERQPKVRCMGVMVELEPVMDGKKVKGFVVKTETFTRNTDDGEVEATAPVIGLCTQSAQLMWGQLNNYYHQLGDLIDIPLAITRNGTKTKTSYGFLPYMEKPVDLAPVVQFLDGISYIGDDLEDLRTEVEVLEDEQVQARMIANFLLDKRITELGDAQRYEELVTPLTLDDMPKNNWGRKASKETEPRRPARPAHQSAAEATETSKSTEPVEERPSKNERFAALRNRVEARS